MVCSKDGRFRVIQRRTWAPHLHLTHTSQWLLCRDCQVNTNRRLWDHGHGEPSHADSILPKPRRGIMACGQKNRKDIASGHSAMLFAPMQDLPGEFQWR
jgi:hypothetical protein